MHLARCTQLFHGRKFLIEPEYQPQLADLGISATMDWVNYANGELISGLPITRCYHIVSNSGNAFYFKRYICPFRRGIQFWMRPGKAAVEVWAYRQLMALGIPTLDVVAFGEERILGVLKSSFLVTRAVPNSQDLDDFALGSWYQMPEPMRRQAYREISSQLVEQGKGGAQRAVFSSCAVVIV
ncbi:MAG: lipopolysaccharide kinase InaA family protein [Candidatus Polarisedimenticolaceae bacterium]|nr:lipopolysaccharide kinase InaA family protein [Candidatus Polarisedimenticolaceae bacterium]